MFKLLQFRKKKGDWLRSHSVEEVKINFFINLISMVVFPITIGCIKDYFSSALFPLFTIVLCTVAAFFYLRMEAYLLVGRDALEELKVECGEFEVLQIQKIADTQGFILMGQIDAILKGSFFKDLVSEFRKGSAKCRKDT